MNKLFKQFVAFAIAMVMVLGMLPTSAMAVGNHDHGHEVTSDVEPFTSTADLIEQVKAKLIEAGKFVEEEPVDQAAVDAVERESDYSYAQAMTMVGLGFFNNVTGTEGEMNVSYLNLPVDTMEVLVEGTLKAYYLDGSVEVEYVEEDGIVTAIRYTLSDSLAAVMEELQGKPAETEEETEAVVASYAVSAAAEKPFPFTDVSEKHWARTAVNYLYQRGIVGGVNKEGTLFNPSGKMTRATMAVMLYRLENEPEVTSKNPFSDVPAGTWYTEAVIWAAENKIVEGDGTGKFNPNGDLTREQLVLMMYRYAAKNGRDTSARADLSKVKGGDKVSSWAKDAVSWAYATGMIKGDGKGDIQAKRVATRAEYAQILYNYMTAHILEEVAAVAPTCTTEGNTQYWVCSDCGKLFADAEGNKEVTKADVTLAKDPTAHNPTPVSEVSPTCTATGIAAHYKCACGLVIDSQGNVVSDMSTLTLPATGHAPAEDADTTVWGWNRVVTNVFGTDAEGNPTFNMGLTDAEGNPIPDFPVDENGNVVASLYYNAETKEVYASYPQEITWECADLTFVCAGCNEEFTVETEVSSYVMTEEWIENATNAYAEQVATDLITDYVTEKAMAYYGETGQAPTEEMQNQWVQEAQNDPELMGQVEQAATIKAYEYYHDLNSTIYTATAEADGVVTQTNELNATYHQLMVDWNTLTTFNADHPQYLGLAAPFWTEKNTDASPLGAILALTGQQEQPFIPNYDMDYMVSMLTQAFMSYVMQYGYMLDAMVAEAVALVDHEELDSIDKLLLLHDWLAEHGTFDMQSLIDITSGESTGNDPIAMTAFGVLLNDQIQKAENATWDGGVCLGYTAAYALLVQQAFGKTAEDEAMIDFVEIKYLTNVAESSVAAGDSGFGDGDAMFNSSHYLNAVNLNGTWYYIDACYDDINSEVISQYRVETDGNVSHDSFLLAPSTWEEMYDGNYQYMDSLYDGYDWLRVSDGQGGYKMQDNEGTVYETEQAAKDAQTARQEDNDADGNDVNGDDLQLFYVYETTEDSTETRYEDTTYEEAWFVGANSMINYDPETQYFYYTAGAVTSYSSMKDMFEDSDDGEDNGMSMDQEDMLQYKYEPSAQDKIVRRPVDATNIPDTDDSGFGMSMTSDEHAEVLFHFGYGLIGADANAQAEADANDNSFSQDGSSGVEDSEKGPYYDLVVEDAAYMASYPDLVHSTVVMDGTIYFNIGNAIYSFNMPINELSQDITQMTNLELVKVKEYNDVTYTSNGKRFAGMSFEASDTGDTLRYHPIAALNVKDVVTWTDADGDGNVDTRNAEQTLYVSIGTNLSNSYKDEEDNAYTIEARNYNPDYYRFMEEEEEGTDTNDNVEFMWCANIIETMPVEAMLEDLASGAVADVTVAAYCEKAAFTESRTTAYGLTKGEKVEDEEAPALQHDYVADEVEGTNICSVCLDDHEHNHTYEGATPEFTWSKVEAAEEGAADTLTANATIVCEDEFCAVVRDDLDETVTYDAETGVYTASVTYQGVEYTATKTMDQFEHVVHDYSDPVFTWTTEEVTEEVTDADGNVTTVTKTVYTACTATFTCEVSTDICLDEDGQRVLVVDCEVTYNDLGEPTASVTDANGVVHTETIHTYDTAPTFTWAEDNTATATFACSTCTEGTEGHTMTMACTVETTNIVEPTCTATGSMDYVAKVTYNEVEYTDTKTVELAIVDHAYEAEFTWAEDNTCTVTYTCVNCGDFYGGACAVSEGVETKAPTCTEVGEMTYTATYEATGDTDTKVEEIPALGHAYNSTTDKCERCGELNPEHVHEYVANGDPVAATCTTDGYTPAACACGESTRIDVVPAAGHSYANGGETCDNCDEPNPDYVAPSVPDETTGE